MAQDYQFVENYLSRSSQNVKQVVLAPEEPRVVSTNHHFNYDSLEEYFKERKK